MEKIAWHQVFSNYQNLNFRPNQHVEHLHIRQNLAGTAIRLELSNRFDAVPLIIDNLRISLNPDFNDATSVTLNHQSSFTIPAHQQLWTDKVPFQIQRDNALYVELSAHNETNTLATAAGVFSNNIAQSNLKLNGNFIYGVSSIAFETAQQPFTVAFFGDSLTNQAYFTDQVLTNLYQTTPNLSGFNAGIAGNRLLRSGTGTSQWTPSFGPAGVQRFRNDVISYQPNLIISLIGINDLVHPGTNSPLSELPTASQMIAGYQQLANEAAVHNIPLVMLTITPFANTLNADLPAWSPEKEQIRQQVNQWLLANIPTIDLASFVADPAAKQTLAANLDSGDHLHFSELGGIQIGNWLTNQLQSYL
ncbi:GDSL-type esterase/lipase family protein [Lactiplantibacillus herbarum]|uniref:GDSL-type esterase/lipase family protein n=1 Tax=Lactiplantibacillus herbarum TaxID=1670446 RepID=UPI00064FADB1|nr:GDSL-type esterase/lipase family protein [Lactiplantibacillus herbarum]